MDSTEAHRSVDVVLAAVKAGEADEAVVTVRTSSSASTRFSNNAITQNLVRCDAMLQVRAAFGNHVGTAATNRLDPESLRETAQRACQIAKAAPPDLEFVPALGPQTYPAVDGWRSATAAITPRQKAERLVPVFDTARAKGIQMAGSFHTEEGAVYLATSRGLWAEHRATTASYVNTAVTESSTGWAESAGPDVDRLDLAAAAELAIEKADKGRNPRELAPGVYPAILEASGLLDLFRFCVWSMDAKAAAEGRSFATGKLGERIGAPNVTIRTVPGLAGCPGSPFVANGLPAVSMTWIEKGILKNLITSRWWAKTHGGNPVPPPVNLVMEPGGSSLDELVRSMKKGLLVTRFWYIRFVDPMTLLLTGMTRDGLFWVEDGKIAYAVKNFRFNDSVLSVLNRIEALGKPRVTGGTEGDNLCSFPDVKVGEFNFASKTEF